MMPEPALQQYLPLVVYAFKALAWVIGCIGGALITVLVWLGKGFIGTQKQLATQLKTVLLILMHCEGCKKSVDSVAGAGRLYDDGAHEAGPLL